MLGTVVVLIVSSLETGGVLPAGTIAEPAQPFLDFSGSYQSPEVFLYFLSIGLIAQDSIMVRMITY
jgi:hypothetical protein